MNQKYCMDLYPGAVYYIAECGCTLEKDQVIKRKRPDILNSRSPMINACPDHVAYINKRLVRCIDCGKISTHDPKNGGLSERCRPCGRTHSQTKSRYKARIKAAEKRAKQNPVAVKNDTEIKFAKENMKVFRNPKAALTFEQAAIKGICCLPAKNLFRFNAMMRGGLI